MKREYNLEEGSDDGSPVDKIGCGSASFNKVTNVMSYTIKGAQTTYQDAQIIKWKVEAVIRDIVREGLANGSISLDDGFAEPNEKGKIYCSNDTELDIIMMMTGDMMNRINKELEIEGESHKDFVKRLKTIQKVVRNLKEIDMKKVVEEAKAKAGIADER